MYSRYWKHSSRHSPSMTPVSMSHFACSSNHSDFLVNQPRSVWSCSTSLVRSLPSSSLSFLLVLFLYSYHPFRALVSCQPRAFQPCRCCIHSLLCNHHAQHRSTQSRRPSQSTTDDCRLLQAESVGNEWRTGLRTRDVACDV